MINITGHILSVVRKYRTNFNCMRKIIITTIGILLSNILWSQSSTEYLDSVINKLDKIKSVSYYSKTSFSAPGDTLVFNSNENYVKMYINPADTFLGAGLTRSPINNIEEYTFCYDGIYGINLDWENRQAKIDTIANDTRFRPMAPFWINVKSLLIYSRENIDNSDVKIQHYKDSTKINIMFKDKVVEFWGLAQFNINSPGKNSRYELLIDNNYLPYQFIRKMPHQTSWETCSKIEISSELDYEFNAIRQIPADFKIKGREKRKVTSIDLEGKRAKNWNLKGLNGKSTSLKDLKGKVVLLHFSGIGCGPCHMSIPFLKQLVKDNMNNDFELICIEAWNKNIEGIKRYKDKNKINYKYLLSDSETLNNYKITGAPVFFILDKKHKIIKVLVGYKDEETNEEILNIINNLL